MTEKVDRRKLRTKRLLRESLLELMEEKGVERVTVSDLTARAGVNRGTFYLHYSDIADMYDQWKGEVLAGVSDILKDFNPFEVGKYVAKGEAYPKGIALLEYIKQHKDFFRVVLGPKGDPSFIQRVKAFIQELMLNHVFPLHLEKNHMQLPPDYLVALMVSANLGIVTHWIESGMALSTDELAKQITHFVHDGPLSLSGMKRLS